MIPTFNQHQYIQYAVDSALAQDYSEIEVIEKCGYKIEEYYGNSWKVSFVLFRRFFRVPGIKRLNSFYEKMILKYFSPNFTDKVLMFKLVAANNKEKI